MGLQRGNVRRVALHGGLRDGLLLLQRLDGASTLLVAGQASSHCVRATVEHLVQHLPGGQPARLLLLTDCMSPVAGFEPQAEAFLAAMRALGVRCLPQAQAAAAL